jgi:isoquinoline 1-oxidoreductase alpha subunit
VGLRFVGIVGEDGSGDTRRFYNVLVGVQTMEITVNGGSYLVDSDLSEMLLWVLRDELGLTGTKYGCGIGMCGSCTVQVAGVATRSCITPLAAVAGREIRTIEGLAETEAVLHPVQQAFLDAQVPQCSWCMSGQMMTAAAFLSRNPDPTDEEITDAMARNYCRCGCYVRIKVAIAKAAQMMHEST